MGELKRFEERCEEAKLDEELCQENEGVARGSVRDSRGIPNGLAERLSSPAQYIGSNLHFLEEVFGDLQRALAGYRALLDRLGDGAAIADVLDEARAITKSMNLEFLLREVPLALRESKIGIAEIDAVLKDGAASAQRD